MVHTKELFSLDGRVAIVTGGRGLYGASISLGLCEMGATVVIASRNGAACEEYAAQLREQGYNAIGLSLDLSDDESIKALAKEVADRYGKIDILVNNAVDRRNMVSLQDATRQKLQDSADTNLQGQILLSQAVLEYMIPAGKGSIINISSMRGLDCPHFPFYPETWGDQPINYTTEKWAMVGMTKYMAGRYGKDHIRVNCIAPGLIMTKLADRYKPTDLEGFLNKIPVGFLGQTEHIVPAIMFLADENASRYIVGQVLRVDGGMVI